MGNGICEQMGTMVNIEDRDGAPWGMGHMGHGHMGHGPHGQWDTWAMGYCGWYYMQMIKMLKDVKLSKDV